MINNVVRDTSVPDIAHQRSRFIRPFTHTTTAIAGKLVPFFCDDVLPGTTLSFDTSYFCRMLTPLFPVMDDCYLTISYFFVPHRLVWEHFKEMLGENNSTTQPWTQPVTYSVPQVVTSGVNTFAHKSIADHLGLPIQVAGLSVSALPFRAYVFIWNSFFRSQVVDPAEYWNSGDSNVTAGVEPYKGGQLLDVCRFHDYFSDAFPTAQKGAAVNIPVAGVLPVQTTPVEFSPTEITSRYPAKFGDVTTAANATTWIHDQGSLYTNNTGNVHIPSTSSDSGTNQQLEPTNWGVNIALQTGTINDLRQAFAVQRYAERLALGGSRYTEQLQSFYGLSVQDSRLQRPEFLGSQTFPINMSQVVQTSETTSGGTPQGNVAGISVTSGKGCKVVYSTQEHGYVMGLFCIRHHRSYQQGIRRHWSKKTAFDVFQPTFSHIGMMSILNKELFANGSSSDSQVFGYTDYADDYRKGYSDVSGEMRSSYSQSLDKYHYADTYATLPTLSANWMHEGATEIARTLALSNPIGYDQFLLQFHMQVDTTAPIPLNGTPGLVDHF